MLQKSTAYRVLDIFFDEPTKKHYLKEISKKVSIAHTSVKNALNSLLHGGLILREYESKGKRKFPLFLSNAENEKFRDVKRISNLEKIYGSGILDELEKKVLPKSVVLFGSYSRGEDIETSDIDLFVESSGKDIKLSKFESRLKRKINLIFREDIDKLPKELKENILNGIVLKGAIEIK